MKSSGRIALLDHLRGLAAIRVAWFHITSGTSGWLVASGHWGWLGVELFFVISGFVIPYSLAGSARPFRISDFPAFLFRRIVRLEPPYLASIALTIVLNYMSSLSPMFNGASPLIDPFQLVFHFILSHSSDTL